MDGLSAAASGIAVVSLAIQLVDSVREIQRFLRSIADAPEELHRLIDLLDQLELILDSVGKLVEHQRIQQGDLDIDVSPIILKAVKTCDNTLKKLDDLIAKAKSNAKAKNPATKYLGRFRLACKKEDIEQIEMQLHRAVTNLNLVMTTNLAVSHSHGLQKLMSGISSTNAAAATITQELVLLRMDVTDNKSVSTHRMSTKKPYQRIQSTSYHRQSTSRLVYKGVLGTIAAKVSSESEENLEAEHSTKAYTREERSWFIIPSFFSRCVQIQYSSAFGSAERVLRTYPIIRDDHPVWKMCSQNDTIGLQQLFSDREISPYSVDSHGATLLHDTVHWFNVETSALLLNFGVQPGVEDARGRRPRGWYLPLEENSMMYNRVTALYNLIIGVDKGVDVAEICPAFFLNIISDPISDFIFSIHNYVTEENVNLFYSRPLEIVVQRMSRLGIDQYEVEQWKQIGKFLINKKADLHWLGVDSAPLRDLIDSAYSTGDNQYASGIVGVRLLDMLHDSNVDVAEYLSYARERRLNPEWVELEAVGDRRRILHIFDREPYSLSWDWWIDPDGRAYEVLHEFRHMGPVYHDCWYELYCPKAMHNWPYIYPIWVSCFEWSKGSWAEEDMKRVAGLFHQRFERRWQKKMTKVAKIQGTYKKSKMPGTWID